MIIENKIQEKAKEELIKAYTYFGMDQYEIKYEIEEQTSYLSHDYDDVFTIDSVKYTGKALQIVSYMGKIEETTLEEHFCTHRKPRILYLFVNNEIIEYDLYEGIGEDTFFKVKNSKHYFAKLEDMNKEDAILD